MIVSSPYYEPSHLPPQRPNRACWWLGCGLMAFAVLAGFGVCGGCFYVGRRTTEKPVAAANAWIRAVKAENWAAAGAVTQGGEPRAKALGADLRGRVGTIQAFHATLLGGSSKISFENGAGHAEIVYSIRGDRGSVACTVVIDGTSDDWLVSDVRYQGAAPPSGESERTAPGQLPESPEGRGSYEA